MQQMKDLIMVQVSPKPSQIAVESIQRLLNLHFSIVNEECKAYIATNGRLKVGENAVTSGGSLPCSFLVHAVGPYFHEVAPNKAIVELYTCV